MPTHGALTKAGKVRAQTPRVYKKEKKPRPSPRISNRKRYIKMLAGKKNELDNRSSRRR